MAYTSFEAAHVTGADDFTVTGSFTSQGIDDNATSTAMTLDGSGNLLVGKTSNDNGATRGIEVEATGQLNVCNDDALVSRFNRLTSDGDIVQFRKDGSTVGSIGVESGGLVVDGGSTVTGLHFMGNHIRPRDNNTDTDSAVSLGNSDYRFNNLFLSGGVYLGGTGSANGLDDYEEGTWTPTVNGQYGAVPSGGADSSSGYYTKIGNVVTATFVLDFADSDGVVVDDRFSLGGLPFTGLDFFNGAGQAFQYGQISTGTNAIWHVIASSSTTFWMYCHHEDGSMNYNSEIRGTVTYRTNS